MTNDRFTFDWPIRRVAIIGAGPGGVPAARQLRDHGLDVTLFERQDRVGGVWNWREDSVGPLSVPTPRPSRGAFTPDVETEGEFVDLERKRQYRFNPPNPCYWNLTNNVPTKTMEFKDFPYPPGTPDNVPHYEFAKYVHDYWKHFDLEALTTLNTRVEKATKTEAGSWKLRLRQQEVVEDGRRVVESTWTDDFDAVLVATGHYNAPLIPNIPGSSEWYRQFPRSIIHSQGYRRPEAYAGQTVLVIGAGTSGMDIAKDLSAHADSVLIAARINHGAPESYRKFRQFLASQIPPRSIRIPEVRAFRSLAPGKAIQHAEIELADGSVISGVDSIIWCTGYQYSYPFLSHLHHDPSASASPIPDNILVTDGDQVLNLYRDVFFIPDPSLAFIGLSVNTSAFSFFEYQSIAVARVWSQQARLPSRDRQRQALADVVTRKGNGKFRHFMGKDGEREYVRETVDWLNRDAKETGAAEVEGHSAQWLWESDQTLVKIAAKYGVDPAGLKNLGGSTADPTAPGPVQEAFVGRAEERQDLNGLSQGSPARAVVVA